jgi:adenylate cyclase
VQGRATPAEVAEGLRLAEDALLNHRDDPSTLTYVATSLSCLGFQHHKALSAVNRALVLNPNSTRTLLSAGFVRTYVLDTSIAIEYFHRVMRLNPLDPEMGYVLSGLALAYVVADRFEEALPIAQKSLMEAPNWITNHLLLLRCLVHFGRIEEARSSAHRLLEIAPQFSVSYYRNTSAFRDPEFIERASADLRIAGIPE